MIHIIERNNDGKNYSFIHSQFSKKKKQNLDEFSFTTCTRDPNALAYHAPAAVQSPKMRVFGALRVENVAPTKLTSAAFWRALLAQSTAEGSEFHRAEILYDVLLPW